MTTLWERAIPNPYIESEQIPSIKSNKNTPTAKSQLGEKKHSNVHHGAQSFAHISTISKIQHVRRAVPTYQV